MSLTNVRNVPEDVKAALIHDMTVQDRSLSDTAVEILSGYFNVASPLSGRNSGPRAGMSDQLQLRVSDELAVALWGAAREWGVTQSQAVIQVLAAHYGLPYVPRNRRGRRTG